MIALLSSSISRASVLRQAGFEFCQLSFGFDESSVSPAGLAASEYVYAVLSLKLAQAKDEISKLLKSGFRAVVLADSCVEAAGQILGKASNQSQARAMLSLQSGARASIFTAMAVCAKELNLGAISQTSFDFASFDKDRLELYLQSGLWQGKAGAMMIEGFSGEFVCAKSGSLQNAMGLDVDILKAFL